MFHSVKARFIKVYCPLETYRELVARIHVVQTEVDMSDMYMVIKVITGCDALHIHIYVYLYINVCVCVCGVAKHYQTM